LTRQYHESLQEQRSLPLAAPEKLALAAAVKWQNWKRHWLKKLASAAKQRSAATKRQRQRLQKLASATKQRSLSLDHLSQLGQPDIPCDA